MFKPLMNHPAPQSANAAQKKSTSRGSSPGRDATPPRPMEEEQALYKALGGEVTEPYMGRDKSRLPLRAYFHNPEEHKHRRRDVEKKLKKMLGRKNLSAAGRAALEAAFQRVYIPPTQSGAGRSSLKVTAVSGGLEVAGRPAFEGPAVHLPGMRPGLARRHIIPWHTISAMVKNMVNAIIQADPRDAAVQELATRLEALTPKRTVEEEVVEPLKRLAVAMDQLLRHMNSSPRNLWAGPRYENSLINVYRVHLRAWAVKLAGTPDVYIQLWRAHKLAQIRKKMREAPEAYTRTLQSLTELMDPETGMPPQEFVRHLPAFADGFEVDLPLGEEHEREKGRMEQTTERARPALLSIAGEFLDLAEKGPAAAEQADSGGLEARINQLTRLIDNFLGR